MELRTVLPVVTTGLNLISGLFVLAGLRFIWRRDRERHRQMMLIGTGFAAAFFIAYVIRIARFGDTPFRGPQPWRSLYYAVLLTHVPLAAVQVPLTLIALWRALVKQDWAGHRRIARITYPIWLYVSATGVVVYVLLHQAF